MFDDSEVNLKFDIEVRGRPVKGYGSMVATHCFLALLVNDTVVDTLSFDPSNSHGWQDADPDDHSRGKVVVQTNCEWETWSSLASAFKRYAGRSVYVLGNHNCCHVVMGALVATNLKDAKTGIHFARTANNTWHSYNGQLGTEDYIKKNA